MNIAGKCHCGNISFDFNWPGDENRMPVRACECTFCVPRNATYTSHPDGSLSTYIRDETRISKYRFGTKTADFYVCSTCGFVPFVTSEIEGNLYGVVNVNTLQSIDKNILEHSTGSFDGEGTGERLTRRSRSWIPNVIISITADK